MSVPNAASTNQMSVQYYEKMRYAELDDKIIQIIEDQKSCLHIVISILTLGIFAVIVAIQRSNLERELFAIGTDGHKTEDLAEWIKKFHQRGG